MWNKEQIPYVVNIVSLKGKLCKLRMEQIDIMANGVIQLCPSIPRWYSKYNLADITEDSDLKLFEDKMIPCPRDVCSCLSTGLYHCLIPNGETAHDYFYDLYMKQGKPEIARLFKNE